jgi:hypothetical protein
MIEELGTTRMLRLNASFLQRESLELALRVISLPRSNQVAFGKSRRQPAGETTSVEPAHCNFTYSQVAFWGGVPEAVVRR